MQLQDIIKNFENKEDEITTQHSAIDQLWSITKCDLTATNCEEVKQHLEKIYDNSPVLHSMLDMAAYFQENSFAFYRLSKIIISDNELDIYGPSTGGYYFRKVFEFESNIIIGSRSSFYDSKIIAIAKRFVHEVSHYLMDALYGNFSFPYLGVSPWSIMIPSILASAFGVMDEIASSSESKALFFGLSVFSCAVMCTALTGFLLFERSNTIADITIIKGTTIGSIIDVDGIVSIFSPGTTKKLFQKMIYDIKQKLFQKMIYDIKHDMSFGDSEEGAIQGVEKLYSKSEYDIEYTAWLYAGLAGCASNAEVEECNRSYKHIIEFHKNVIEKSFVEATSPIIHEDL
jgi:hypothetical protein